MIRTTSSKQLTIAEFDWPFETVLDKNNRWVKLADCLPWDELAESYYQGMRVDRGRPMKDARLVIGAVIIKHKLCLSDVETVQQIQENPYMLLVLQRLFFALCQGPFARPIRAVVSTWMQKLSGRFDHLAWQHQFDPALG